MSVTVIVKSTVQSFDSWKQAFDGAEPARRGSGGTSFSVHRDPKNDKVVHVISRWPTLEKATGFLELQRARIQAAGIAAPEVTLLEDVSEARY